MSPAIPPPMRSQEEVQRAHDMLVGVLTGEAPDFPGPDKEETIAMAAVLCWVLRHDHNDRLEGYMKDLEEFHARMGITFESDPEQGATDP